MARVYADAEAQGAYTDVQLRTASRVVDQLLRGVVYDVDDAGMPTDPDVLTALQDATAAIARELQASGTLEAGGTTQWQSVGIGNVSLSGRQSAAGSTEVAGVAVPADALVALADVGRLQVVVT